MSKKRITLYDPHAKKDKVIEIDDTIYDNFAVLRMAIVNLGYAIAMTPVFEFIHHKILTMLNSITKRAVADEEKERAVSSEQLSRDIRDMVIAENAQYHTHYLVVPESLRHVLYGAVAYMAIYKSPFGTKNYDVGIIHNIAVIFSKDAYSVRLEYWDNDMISNIFQHRREIISKDPRYLFVSDGTGTYTKY